MGQFSPRPTMNSAHSEEGCASRDATSKIMQREMWQGAISVVSSCRETVHPSRSQVRSRLSQSESGTETKGGV